jgi:hypothetical protein
MTRVMGTVHPIMTVTVKQHKVGEPRVCAVLILMMHCKPITCCEVQSPRAASVTFVRFLTSPRLRCKTPVVVPSGIN